jgi:hypothetical protein
VAGLEVVADPVEQPGGRREIGKALGQVDRAVVGRQLGHHREDRGADVRELAVGR